MTITDNSVRSLTEPRQVYYWKWRGLLVALLAAILLFFLIMVGQILSNSGPVMDSGLRLFIIIFLFLLIDLVALLCLGVWNLRLVTSPHGIEYYNIGFSLRSPWSNLTGQRSIQTTRGRTLSGIGLKQPVLQMDSWFRAAMWLMPFFSLIALLRGRVITPSNMQAYAAMIPVDEIVPDWESGELGSTIRRYAPQVFAPEMEIAPAETPALPPLPLEIPASYLPAASSRWLMPLAAVGVFISEVILVFVLLHASSGETPLWSSECSGRVDQIAVSSENLVRAICETDIYTWRLSDGMSLGQQQLQGISQLSAYAFSPDAQKLVAGAGENQVWVWQIASGARLRTLSLDPGEQLTTVAFSPDGQLIAAGASSGSVRLWRASDDQPYAVVQQKSTYDDPKVIVIAWSPKSQAFVDLQYVTDIALLRSASDASLQATLGHQEGFISAAAFSPDGRTLALGNANGDIWLVTLAGGVSRAMYQNPEKKFDEIFSIAYSPKGDLLAAGDTKGAVRVFQVSTGTLLHTFWHTKFVTALVFSPDGQRLISGSEDYTVKVWSVATPPK